MSTTPFEPGPSGLLVPSGLVAKRPRKIVYFSDCWGDHGNAKLRILTAVDRELDGADLETYDMDYPHGFQGAAMTLVDVLSAAQPVSQNGQVAQIAICGNAAPRATSFGQQRNGHQFCWAVVGGVLIVTTYSKEFFALAHRLGLLNGVNLIDPTELFEWAIKQDLLTHAQARYINGQFRGLTLVPWLTRMLLEYGQQVPAHFQSLGDIVPAAGIMMRTDGHFGNLYLDVLPGDVRFAPGNQIQLVTGELVTCYNGLAEIPPGQLGLVISSSGYLDRQFLMLAKQGGNARRAVRVGRVRLARTIRPVKVGDQIIHPSMIASAAIAA